MITTAIHFDYGGSYVETEGNSEWNAKSGSYRALPFKTPSLEDITYSVLEEKIRKKIGVDKGAKIKMSYFPLDVGSKQQSYILDDEDVRSYLYSMNAGLLRSLLHVEIDECAHVDVRVERISSVGMNYGEMDPNGRAKNVITTYEEEEENSGPLEEIVCVRDGENMACVDVDVNEGVNVNVNDENDENVEFNDVPLRCDEEEEGGTDYVEEWDDGMDLEVGHEFVCKDQVKNLVFRAANKRLFDYDVLDTDTRRYVVRCRERECKWYMRVSRPKGSQGVWTLSVYRKMHCCSRVSSSTTNVKRRGSSSLVASIVQDDYPGILETPTPKSLIGVVHRTAGVTVSYSTALRGKKKAAFVVRGNPEESYKALPSYLFMLEKTNIGTITKLVLDKENRFKYLFIALGACIEGFAAMRKVLSVDATFLKTVHGGVLIIATAQDPNHHHYPIAFSVVDGENLASWKWFFTMLKTIIPDDPELVFLSDRNAGLIKAVRDVYPRSSHGYCFFHLSQNVRTWASNHHKDVVAKKFRELANIYTVTEFDKEYEEFRRRYPKVAVYLDKSVEVTKWARCYFPGLRYNIGTTNGSESLNKVFKEARKYSLLLMIDTIIDKLVEWFSKHRKESAGGSDSRKLVPFVENDLSIRCEEAAVLIVHELNIFWLEYSVVGEDGKTYLVNLREKSCACRSFDLDKYPCVHGVAALLAYMSSADRTETIHLWNLCTKYYLKEMWALAYYRTIYPVPDQSQWAGIPNSIQALVSLPPGVPERKGRLQEVRKPSVGEKRRKKASNRPVVGLDLEGCFNSGV